MSFDAERAASSLVEARVQHRQLEPFSPGPATAAEAYAVQDAVARRLGPLGGWKVGAKSPGETPNAAPLFANLVRPSPERWPSASLHMIGVEAELAFRIGRDLKPRSEPMTSEEIWASIASVHAAIEIVDTRLANWKYADRLWVLADNQSNGGFVYDPNGISLTDRSFADAPVRLEFDGRVVVEKRGGNPAGDPRWLVEWLTTHCAQSRGGLLAGQFVTTGSYTGMLFVAAGAAVMASFKGIGTVTVSFP